MANSSRITEAKIFAVANAFKRAGFCAAEAEIRSDSVLCRFGDEKEVAMVLESPENGLMNWDDFLEDE